MKAFEIGKMYRFIGETGWTRWIEGDIIVVLEEEELNVTVSPSGVPVPPPKRNFDHRQEWGRRCKILMSDGDVGPVGLWRNDWEQV